MPIFLYKARDLQGVDHKGTIDTVDESRVAKVLSRKGLVVTSLVEKKDHGFTLFDDFFNRVPFSDLVVATRQLATMIESGLVLSEALDILVEQQSNPKLKKIFEEVSSDIKSGLDLASALKKHPNAFSPLFSSLIKSGEEAGNLDVVLTQMADNLEKEREFRSRVRGALIYPVIIVIIMILVTCVMMFFVIPRLTGLYSQSNIELPLPTKILIGTSNFFIGYWWLMLIIIGVLVIAFRKYVSTVSGKYAVDAVLLKTPIVGRIIRGVSLTTFIRNFGLLIAAGVPILDAISIVSDVIGNWVYKKALLQTHLGIERGLTLSAQLEASGAFPKIISQMFRVGEETGKIDKVAFKLSDYFESEADHTVKNLTVLIEPVILLVLGVGVAFLVLSIILPIYQLTTSFS